MGDNTETATSTNAPSNPLVNTTLTNLLGKVNSTFDARTAAGTPPATQAGWTSSFNAANNPDYAKSVNGAISDFGDVAAGNRFGTNDPGYAALRAKAGDDTLRDVNSMFTASNRFGSGSHVGQATESLGNVYAGLDYANNQQDITRQQNAAQMLPSLFASGQAPGSAMASVGQSQMAQPWYNLGQASGILGGTAGAGGTTSTQETPQAPWWQQALGAGAIGSGIYKNIWGS